MPASDTDKTLRIPFDSLSLRAVTTELRTRMVGGQIQDVRQPLPTELLLGIRSQGQNYLLLLSDDARFARVHLVSNRRPNAPTPPTFCMALRKHLEGGILRDLRQRGFDRILEMEVGAHAESDASESVTLIAELMGKHSNLILVNDNGMIVDAAKRITHRINRVREVLPGLPYQPPPEQAHRIDPFLPDAVERLLQDFPASESTTHDVLAGSLRERIAGMSPFLAREIALRAVAASDLTSGLKSAWNAIFGAAARGDYAPTLVRHESLQVGAYPFPTVQFPTSWRTPVPDLNQALETVYSQAIERADLEATLGELRGKIERSIKQQERRKETVQRTLDEAHRAEEYKQVGDLLLANLWRVQPGDTTVTVQDFYHPDLPERTLTLDPTLSAAENAEAYFRRSRKARDSQETAQERGAQIEATLQRLAEARTRLDVLQTPEEITRLRTELQQEGLLRGAEEEGEENRPGGTGPDFQGHKIRRYFTPEGYEIYVGETATANDFLTTRVASPNDLWLHVRASTSAHVIIRTHGQPAAVPRAVLERAALLCAQHSSQKHSALVPVDYTLRKYVRKPRGAAPGSADYRKEKTLHVTP